MPKSKSTIRNLVIVLGDQLDRESVVFDDFDQHQDAVWMAEVKTESTHVWSHCARIAVFLSAMRHFRNELLDKEYVVHYRELGDPNNCHTLGGELRKALKEIQVETILCVPPGDFRVWKELKGVITELSVPVDWVSDRHFLCNTEEFAKHARGRKQLRLEYFYREMRQKYKILMAGKQPEGGTWNFDQANRGSFGKNGPGSIPPPLEIPPDSVTTEVLALVNEHFPEHPGELKHFAWPVTPTDGRRVLEHFVTHLLPNFGTYQDAMWTEEPFLYHSRLSVALNLKLIHPLQVVKRAEEAYQCGAAPLEAVEGFIRQILGWREYVRGIYWLYMPEYLTKNALNATLPLPKMYWTGDTDYHCLQRAIGQTLKFGYAHHIQRLMVTGLFSLLLGVDPQRVHEWYLAVYVDAVEWVELPNTLGMSQFADGGIMASKPYAATGKYISRMSNYCKTCRYRPEKSTGDDACPFTTLYWEFLLRNEKALLKNQRMSLQMRNLERLSDTEREEIYQHAQRIRLKVLA